MPVPEGQLAHFFSSEEIDAAAVNDDTWLAFGRKREAEFIFSRFGQHRFRAALELGAGDGRQSITIAQHCERLVCTELDEKRLRSWDLPDVEYRICNAEDLSCFRDHSFDLLFSSNMLEHLSHPERCLAEAKRVLMPGGLLIVTVPSRIWKIFNVLLSLCRGKLPRVHGIAPDHVTEFFLFSRRRWERMFRKSGFRILQVLRLPFYVGHGPRFVPLIKAGNRARFSASTGFILGQCSEPGTAT
jgi:ubiquinone/menaquinone biosynthesis C-methylase UbiE